MKKENKIDDLLETSEIRDENCEELFIDEMPTDWIAGEVGKAKLNTSIIKAAKKLFDEGALIYPVLKLNFTQEKISVIIDIKRDKVENALTKVMSWAIETEQYEICQEVKTLADENGLKITLPELDN